MTSLRAIIHAIDEGLSDRRLIEVYYDKGRMGKISKEVGYLRAVSGKYGFELIESDAENIEKMTLGTTHGGIIARASERTVPRLSEEKINPDGFYVMLQGIEDPYNFGYSLRSLYAVGCDGVVLDERNWLSAAGVVARSSAGASELLPFFTASATDAVDIFSRVGYKVVMADLRTDNTLGDTPLPYPIFLVVGGEKRGLSAELLKK
ncbi:MAG: RNA methyltransferase, partial [Clostridia bacterium]|nr:RNA methyltransferase [Clostridia bacterium]